MPGSPEDNNRKGNMMTSNGSESLIQYNNIAKISGALTTLQIAVGRLIAHQPKADMILEEIGDIIGALSDVVDQADHNRRPILEEWFAAAQEMAHEIGSESAGDPG